MSTEFHDEPEDDSSTFWQKDSGPVQFSFVYRYRRWLLPALGAAFILIIIIAFGVNNGKLSSRLSSMEATVSNLSDSLSAAQKVSKDAVKDVQRLRFSVESNKDQLTSVVESLKQLVALESLSKTVTTLKCSLDRLIHNRTEVSGCCPLDWDMFETSCYFFSKASLNWHDARDWCNSHQGQLVILNKEKDWDYVNHHALGTFFWVGLTDEKGKWEWVNGTPYTMDRRHWRPGQPDNWTGHGAGEGAEDCAHLHNDGRLNDLHCTTRLRFICQKHIAQS